MMPLPDEGPGAILIAPGGYDQKALLEDWTRELQPLLQADAETQFSEGYFKDLAAQCVSLGLQPPQAEGASRWAKALSETLWICIQDWDRLEDNPRLASFWHEVLQVQSPHLRFLMAARKPPRLPLAQFVAQGGRIYERRDLSWSEAQTEAFWRAAGREWNADSQSFWERVQGWPLALRLYLRRQQDELSPALFEQLLQQAILDWFPPFIQAPQQLWAPETQARLKQWQLPESSWPPIIHDMLGDRVQQSPHYWLRLATAQELPPEQARVYLERALSLCGAEHEHVKLKAITRLMHMSSLLGDWAAHDQWLKAGEELEAGAEIDRAAWYYLLANRLRQSCRYAEAHAALDQLLTLPAQEPAVMNFQTRARIMRGLTAYQQGDYARTRRAYQEAMFLAEADENHQMQLELRVMLAFLDVLTGEEGELPEDIESQVMQMPLSAQPLVWLNLTFYQILGEHLDIEKGQKILERVRASSHQLGWKALLPQIADVEARMYRFAKDYERALRLHSQAREQLDENSFDWLYASLNESLTRLRLGQQGEAKALLEQVVQGAQASGSLGLLREAQAALRVVEPKRQAPPAERSEKRGLEVNAEGPRLEIQCFGSFQVRLDGQLIERWPRKRARQLFIQLLLHPHGIHRETLADWLTGSDDLEQALRSLDVHIHSLRKVLEPQRKGKQASRYVQFHDACYSYNWDCHYFWDAERFNRCHQIWLKARQSDIEAAERSVAEALNYYHGPFLPELDFADDWIAEREGYARKASDLVHWSLDSLIQAQQYELAEERAEQLLRWEPLSESGFIKLFDISSHMGDRTRLERLGERMEQTYEKELGSAPPGKLTQHYLTLMKELD